MGSDAVVVEGKRGVVMEGGRGSGGSRDGSGLMDWDVAGVVVVEAAMVGRDGGAECGCD